MTVHPTWDHPSRHRYPGLEGQPSIEALFAEVAARPELAGRTCLVDGDVRLTATELTDRVQRLAGGLASVGVSTGSAVAFQLPNWWETVACYRACWRLGAVAVPIHHLAAEADVDRALDLVAVDVLIAAAGSPTAGRRDRHGRAAHVVRPEPGSTLGETTAFEHLLSADPVTTITASPTDPAVVLFTSGSTGGPKGVVHTHRALAYKARSLLGIHGLDHRDTVLMPAPMAHISGLSNAVMQAGAGGMCSVLMAKWSPDAALDLIAAEGVTVMTGPPTFFQTMMSASTFSSERVATLRLISCGGAGVTPAFVEAASAAFGAVVKRTYGSTEAPVATTWRMGDPPEMSGAADGRAAGEIELRVVDATSGLDRPDGESGELWLRGPELFVGYTDPARTAEAIADGDWFRTGDLATLEEESDGNRWVRIVGRIKDIIIRGGENISAAEVEALLEAHPLVHQAVAVGYPDERLGERVCAYIVLAQAPDAAFDLDECRRWFESRGATKFTWPERVEVIGEMPVLASSGKVDRAALRALAAN